MRCTGYRHSLLRQQIAYRRLLADPFVDPLAIVEHQVLAQVTQKSPRLANRVFMHFNELFTQASLIPFHASIDPGTARITPQVRYLVRPEIIIQLTMELAAIVRLDIPNRQRVDRSQFLREIFGIATAQPRIRQRERDLSFDADRGVEIDPQSVEGPHERIHLPMVELFWMRGIAHPDPWIRRFP